MEFSLKQVPIVAVTANAMQGDRRLCLEAGMDEYLTQPVQKEPLINTIERVLHPRHVRTSYPRASPDAEMGILCRVLVIEANDESR